MSLERYNRVIVWGGGHDLHSHRHIHAGFLKAAQRLGLHARWVGDDPGNRFLLQPGTLVIAADVWGKHLGEAVPGVDYVLHNFDGSHELCQSVAPENLLRLQVYTNAAAGEQWAPLRYYHREARTLFQPWGTDLFAEEFLEPAFNPASREVVYVGAIWADFYEGRDLGNVAVIDELKLALADHGLRFNHRTQISDAEMIEATRAARLAPAFAGQWQVEHDYAPCRCFKNPSYGALCVTQVPAVSQLFAGCHVAGETVPELIDEALSLRRADYVEMVEAQQKIAARYSYREALHAIGLALEKGQT